MLKKMSLRLRLTVLSIALLTLCCVCLTLILNLSANQMANVIEITPVIPANTIDGNGTSYENAPEEIDLIPINPSENSQAARKLFLYQSIFAMLFVVAAGGGLTYVIAGKALKPLQELSHQMKSRTVHNLSEILSVPESHDEIYELTVSFNEMSRKLDEAFAIQKRFSQSAAHELRTPLTVLKTKVDVFKKKPEHTAEEYEKLLSVITTHTNRLSALVNDLLELTNIDALECKDYIKIKTMLTDISEELSDFTKGKNIAVTICGEEQTVCGNQSLLHRAFYNLIENAIKYNVENGKIKITVSREEECTIITVADTGIGIPAKLQKHIFEPFFRVDKSRSRQMGGAGLGLATVKNIMDKHGFLATVSSNTDGGTVFKITLK